MTQMDVVRRLGPLTEHFSWFEVFASDTADRLGIDNMPDGGELVRVMPRVVVTAWFLEQVRGYLGDTPMGVNSWWRSAELNAYIPGASRTSNHLLGWAVDATHRSGPATIIQRARARAEGLGWGYELILYPSFAHVAPLPDSPSVRKCLRLAGGKLVHFEPATVRT